MNTFNTDKESEDKYDDHKSASGASTELTEDERNELLTEFNELKSNIETLQAVLHSKMNRVNQINKRLGATPMNEFKTNIKKNYDNIKNSEAFQATNDMFKSFGNFASRTFNDIKNSEVVQKVGTSVSSAVTQVKSKVVNSETGEVENEEKTQN
ncbi:hypothetical protein A3Q56_05928 [Intoshia linei]|uniref:Tumor protein D52 n=1 Tax=Intoshia linei TaxID=1819745 RepID=A0A177AYU6_9BILA|nr:hypothetical protein A3Q56_05928 [Intoshia linei]